MSHKCVCCDRIFDKNSDVVQFFDVTSDFICMECLLYIGSEMAALVHYNPEFNLDEIYENLQNKICDGNFTTDGRDFLKNYANKKYRIIKIALNCASKLLEGHEKTYNIKIIYKKEYEVKTQKIYSCDRSYKEQLTLWEKFIERMVNFLYKCAFPLLIGWYILELAQSFMNENVLVKWYLSLFMGLLSFGISIFYSNWFEQLHDKYKKLPIDRQTEWKRLLFFFYSCVFAGIFQIATLILIENSLWWLEKKDDIGNVLSWISLIIFSVEKTLCKE